MNWQNMSFKGIQTITLVGPRDKVFMCLSDINSHRGIIYGDGSFNCSLFPSSIVRINSDMKIEVKCEYFGSHSLIELSLKYREIGFYSEYIENRMKREDRLIVFGSVVYDSTLHYNMVTGWRITTGTEITDFINKFEERDMILEEKGVDDKAI